MKKRLESKEGRSGRGSSQLNVSNLSKLLVMSEDALDTDNESVYTCMSTWRAFKEVLNWNKTGLKL